MSLVDAQAGADDPLETLVQLAWDERVGSSLWYATYTLLVYDYLCTFEKEVKYVWTCPWSIGLVLFYLNRYFPFLDLPLLSGLTEITIKSEMACKLLAPIYLGIMIVGTLITSAILLLRTYAIWGRRRLILYILASVVVIFFGTDIVLIVQLGIQSSATAEILPDPIHPGKLICIVGNPRSLETALRILLFYLLVFVTEAVVVSLTIIRANEHLRQSSSQWVVQLYKNGIIYCIAILVMSLANAIMAFAAPIGLNTIFLPLQRNLHSIFCNRVMFLILENRNARRTQDALGQREQPSSHVASIMETFTTVDFFTVDSAEDGSDTWQERARREWVE
ncbi:hypothetical protein BDZ97DRAFT_601931 [Flammula alnicola]|nr:hypothetical protein BDZ97DRAFT_601931 [Flammula alnicola]